MTYDDRLNIAQCARQRGQQAAADGDRGRYYRETAASFRLLGWYGTAATFDRLAEGVGCQLEAAAREVEQCLTTDTTIRAAYDQGRADERERIVSLLSCWRDAIPSGRLYASTRRTLESITDSITS